VTQSVTTYPATGSSSRTRDKDVDNIGSLLNRPS
jgi:hypothetical protein